MSHARIHRDGSAPFARKAARRLHRTAPELWAEQERRRVALEREDVQVTYRRASALPPEGELRRIVLGDARLDANEPRELRFIGETMVKMWTPRHTPYRQWLKAEGPRVMSILQRAPAYVADVGGGVVLGFVVAERSLVHCLFVKADFRGLGLGLGLLREAGVTVPVQVHNVTNSWRRWTQQHGIEWDLVKEDNP